MSAPIIITLPNNYMALGGGNGDSIPTSPPSRKRRLEHLSWEEKMQRKKLKNRVAAQTSRDRKKAKMDVMEHRVCTLEQSNAALLSDMASLKALNERLIAENESLRVKVRDLQRAGEHLKGEVDEQVRAGESGERRAVGTVGRGAPGSAESFPRPQGGAPRPAAPAARLLLMSLMLCKTFSAGSTPTNISTACKRLQTPSSERLLQMLKEKMKERFPHDLLSQQKWWGPHQSNWNPVDMAA